MKTGTLQGEEWVLFARALAARLMFTPALLPYHVEMKAITDQPYGLDLNLYVSTRPETAGDTVQIIDLHIPIEPGKWATVDSGEYHRHLLKTTIDYINQALPLRAGFAFVSGTHAMNWRTRKA